MSGALAQPSDKIHQSMKCIHFENLPVFNHYPFADRLWQEPFHNKPKPGLVSPWHFRNVRKYPPGKEYDLYDYGLMEDYQLVEK